MHWAAPAIAAAAALPASAEACRLALVLALDVSSSVDAREYALQRDGLASALLDPSVNRAFFAAPEPVALYVFEWSGRYDQVALLPDWTLIETPADLANVAGRIAASTRSRADMPTALGYALGHASVVLKDNPGCLFSTIDVSGDGTNNEGFGPASAYAAFPFDGVTVNALAIRSPIADFAPDLPEYFRTNVIRGPGAFVETAAGFEDYARAMRRKLLTELSVQVIGGVPTAEVSPG
ncbi:DUF1194 domain-containing protein [Flavimaricola marinus]|uniref:VWFA domain-containing protein n=1 Tax=Flavimaricola marinus TaxID=1819565 RepID=A0A238LIT7_9RHOB|nr:DUF1194 domain-containing protein [Flavimaricola marinus]SMY09463.1 hypothetical protein LOM8899_03630 [Flavimaricola marinus]